MKQKYKWITGELIFAIGILAYLVYIFISCLNYGAYTRLVPLVVVSWSLVCIVIIIVKTIRRERKKQTDNHTASGETALDSEESEKGNADEESGATPPVKKYLEIFAWTLLCPLMIYLFGFMVGSPIYCLIFTKLRGKSSWITAIIAAVVIAGMMLLLNYVIGVFLHPGLIFQLL